MPRQLYLIPLSYCVLVPVFSFVPNFDLLSHQSLRASKLDVVSEVSEALRKNSSLLGEENSDAELSTEFISFVKDLNEGKLGGWQGFIAREKEWGQKRTSELASAKVRDFREFLDREIEWGGTVMSSLFKRGRRRERAVTVSAEGRWRRLRRFVNREVDWGEKVRRKFVEKKVTSDRELNRAMRTFLTRNRADFEKLAEKAVNDELAVRGVASSFLDGELSKVFPVLDVCTDGLACGRNGGLDLFEAVCAFQHALGLDRVLVRPAHCESVCPRDGSVAVKCPDSRARLCNAPETDGLLKAVGAAHGKLDEIFELPVDEGLDRRQSTIEKKSLAASVLIDTPAENLNEAGLRMAAELASLLVQEDAQTLLNDLDGLHAGVTGESVLLERPGSERVDFSRRSNRDSRSWSVVAARLVALECQRRSPIGSASEMGLSVSGAAPSGCYVGGDGVVSDEPGNAATLGGVPLELVLAHRAKHLGDAAAARGEWKRAGALYSFAIDHAPGRLLEPYQPNEQEAFQAAELAKRTWAGSMWVEMGRTNHPRERAGGSGQVLSAALENEAGSVLTIAPLEYLEAFFTGGGYGSSGGSEVEVCGRLSSLSSRGGGILEGRWSEQIGNPASTPENTETTQGPNQDGTFRLKMNSAGHAFLGERYDQHGSLLGLWHGYRLLASGPPASRPPTGMEWIHSALVGRARARLNELALGRDGSDLCGSGGRQQGYPDLGGGEQDEALAAVVADCELAISVWPRDPEVFAVLAAAKEHQHDVMGAIEALEESLFLQPPAPVDVSDMAALEALRKRSPEAATAAVAAADAVLQLGEDEMSDQQVSGVSQHAASRVQRRQQSLSRLWLLAERGG